MTTPSEPDFFDGDEVQPEADEDDEPRKVSVPFRRGDGLFIRDERVRVDPENAVQWDDRRWRDRP
ncbi:hypothetical protein [Mycobacterium simiae]|uniref:hypothetical protein n=1 Tax=Mycobacterium simiae TaxID=1784 RepID=UPI002617F3E3|nr:hypothetical protein [Mycobacterium simiae]